MNFRPFFERQRREKELEEEIRAHLAMATRDRIEQGEAPQTAEQAARREFGNRAAIEEATRDAWGWRVLHETVQDVRYAIRGMRANPGFTGVAVLSLALGIGANTAIFSLMQAIMLRALPVSHPEQLVELLQKYPGEPRGNGYWTWKSYEHYRDHNHVFSAMTGTGIDHHAPLELERSRPEFATSEFVLGNYFQELGIKPALGRLIAPEDSSPAAVLSWAMWTNRFQQDPAVLGKVIWVKSKPATVIGVAPRNFTGLLVETKTDVWLRADPTDRLALLGRLKPGVTIEQARAEMAVLYQFTIEERSAGSTDPQVRKLRVEVEPCGTGLSTVRDRFGTPLTILMASVGVLLLLACINIAGMLLARGAGRAREIALRLGLGASRGRLVRQMLTEAMLLSGAGALAGAALAYFGADTLLRILDSGRLHERVQLDLHLDAGVFGFTVAVAVITGVLFGIAPAWHAFHSSPALALRQSGKAAETRGSRLLGKGLVASQVALSILLLSCAGLLIGHLAQLKGRDLGFRRDHVLLVSLDSSNSGYGVARVFNSYHELLNRVRAIPGVQDVSVSAPTPLSGAGASGFGSVEGFRERPEDRRWISIAWVAPRYFETLRTPLLAGRDFDARDEASARVAIINQTLARHYFAGAVPLGKRITIDHRTGHPQPETFEIVGVVGDANYLEIRESERRALYLPAFSEGRAIGNNLVIRTDVDPESISGAVRGVVREVAPAIAVATITTLSRQIDASIVPERLMAMLSGFFALVGALLAGIGLYGLLAYTVAQRTSEIGIRMALGATSARVVRMILRDASGIVGVGLGLGIPLSIWGRRLAAALIQDLSIQPAAAIAVGAIAILAVALLASYVPARRAARVDPMESLRHE